MLFKYTCRPSWKFSTKLIRAVEYSAKRICERLFCKKGSPSRRYLRNFSGFQKYARLESAVFGIKFTKKEQHYRLQSRHLRKLFGVNITNCIFLGICTPVQVIVFLAELYNEEISPTTLLKSDSARGSLLAILQNRQTHK